MKVMSSDTDAACSTTGNTSNAISVKCGPSSLSMVERVLNWVTFSSAVAYALWRIYLSGQENLQVLYHEDFSFGWDWIGLPKDISDREWHTFSPLVWNLVPQLFIHAIAANFLRSLKSTRKELFSQIILPLFYILFSMSNLIYLLGIRPMAYVLCHVIAMFGMSRFRQRRMVWLGNIIFLLATNALPFSIIKEYVIYNSDKLSYIMSVTSAWTCSRCLSYGVDRCNKPIEINPVIDFIHLLSYVIYLPLLFFGPFVPFQFFEDDMLSYKEWTLDRAFRMALNFVRYIFWFLFIEFILHYMYFNAVQFQPRLVEQLGLWEICGLCYSLGQFFMLKYVVFFGLPSYFARAEGYRTPPHPKCIGRVHLYSQMWKNFDRGLYIFLVRYIFIPCMGTSKSTARKLLVSAICFLFVFLWHGVEEYVFLWACLNFIGVVIEQAASYVGNQNDYQLWEKRIFSPAMAHRFHCAIASPLLLMSCLSNFYFFSGKTVGDIYVRKMLIEGFPFGTFTILFVLYFTCQISNDYSQVEEENRDRQSEKSHF